MTLIDCIKSLHEFDELATIYAQEPWTESSTAVVVQLTEEEVDSAEATQNKVPSLSYFIEVHIARDFLEGYVASLAKPPTSSRQCKRLIRYAITDA